MPEMAEGEYEALRAANVKRNQEIMRALGLDMSDFQLHSAHKDSTGKGKSAGKGAKGAPAPRKRKADTADGEGSEGAPTSPATTRKSARIRGAAPEHAGDPEEAALGEEGGGGGVHLVASDELHDAAERDHLRWAGKQGKATIVGTASYKHTLHRVSTRSSGGFAEVLSSIRIHQMAALGRSHTAHAGTDMGACAACRS